MAESKRGFMSYYAPYYHVSNPGNAGKSTSYHWWFHLSPYAAHVRPRPKFPAREDVASVLNTNFKARGSTRVLHRPASCGQTPCRLHWCCRWVSLWHEKDTRDMMISLNVSTKAQHLCWSSLKSSDLDTSDDFSEELDRSHGFFTASGEGQGGRHDVTDILIHSFSRAFWVSCTCWVLLTSATRVILQEREIHHHSTAQTQRSRPNSPRHSHRLRVLWWLTSSGFSDAFRLRTEGSFSYWVN